MSDPSGTGETLTIDRLVSDYKAREYARSVPTTVTATIERERLFGLLTAERITESGEFGDTVIYGDYGRQTLSFFDTDRTPTFTVSVGKGTYSFEYRRMIESNFTVVDIKVSTR